MTEQDAARAEVLRTRDFVGWDVVDRTGEKIAAVADLLIDRGGRIRYLDVEFGLPRKHVLLPEHQLEWGERNFVAGRWERDQVRGLPPYESSEPLNAARLAELERAYPWFYGASSTQAEPDGPLEGRIVPLSEAKHFKLASGAPDPRGWNVFGADGERLGTVAQLLVDPEALKIRYLDVDLLDDLYLLRDDRHVLVPLEQVELKERGNDAWVQRLPASQVALLPAYQGGAVPGWLEQAVSRHFAE